MSSIFSYSQKIADFSGEWILNKSQSKSVITNLATSSIVISQDVMSLTMDIKLVPENHEPIKRIENYVLNTSIHNKVTKPEDKSRQVDTKLAQDGQSFTITETISYNKDGVQTKLQRTETYLISEDGKTLTIKTDDLLPEKSLTPEEDRHETRVYNKKI
jgi:hypothetical protein